MRRENSKLDKKYELKKKNNLSLDDDSNLDNSFKSLRIGGENSPIQLSKTKAKIDGELTATSISVVDGDITINGSSVITEASDVDALNDLSDVTYSSGDLTIDNLDTIYLPNTTSTTIQTKGKLLFRDWGAGASFDFLEIDEDGHTIKMDNDTGTFTTQVSSHDTYLKAASSGTAEMIMTATDRIALNSNLGKIDFFAGGLGSAVRHSWLQFGIVDGLNIYNQFQIENYNDVGDDYFNIQVWDKGATIINTVDDAGAEAHLDFVVDGQIDFNASTVGFTAQTATGDGTTTIDWSTGNKFHFTFGAQNETITFGTNPAKPCNLLLSLKQDGTGSRTVTWAVTSGTIYWSGGGTLNTNDPTLTTTGTNTDIISFYFDGTNYYGVASLNFAT